MVYFSGAPGEREMPMEEVFALFPELVQIGEIPPLRWYQRTHVLGAKTIKGLPLSFLWVPADLWVGLYISSDRTVYLGFFSLVLRVETYRDPWEE